MIAFIDDHREAHGVEPICKVLPIAPSTYHAHVARRVDPAKRSARAKRDAALKPEVRRVFDDNFQVYGVRKVWRQLRRENHDVARCTVERLMHDMGLQGAIRGKPVRTTVSVTVLFNAASDWAAFYVLSSGGSVSASDEFFDHPRSGQHCAVLM